MLYTFFSSFVFGSPLDQFGSDGSIGDDFIEFLYCSFLSTLDIFDFNDFFDVSFLMQGLLSSLMSVFIGDDDVGDSVWEDNDLSVSALQSSILVSNLFGMIPGLETATANPALTFFYSLVTMSVVIHLGVAIHSIRFLSILFPAGTPIIMAPFIVSIEFISYMARAVSLGMRLFANMFAGHSLVKILMSFAWLFLTSAFPILSVPVFIILVVIFFLELSIAYLQSYVFGALSAMYFEDMVLLGH